jgi:parallel beta-helix repeat protein
VARKLKLVLLVVLVGAMVLPTFFSATTPSASAYTTHGTIFINSNADFTLANGVTSGSGTSSDPWIIENWVINDSSANGIYIKNTTAYFVVRNCLVENGGSNSYGIYLDNASNGRIENNIVENNKRGIRLTNSSNYNTLVSNTCSNDNYYGIYLYDSDYNNLNGNTCENNRYYGIYLYSSSDYNNLNGNTCENNSYGIYLSSSNTGNIITLNYLLNSTTNNGYDNDTNAWDNNGLGNYWSDWQSPDADNNKIVDTPRTIAGGTNQDGYPLVVGWFPNVSPNVPTTLLPLLRQTTTSVNVSCFDNDNDGNTINVFFYEDNASHDLIDNVWITSGGTATRTWNGLMRGVTYTFFARGQDNNGAWSDNSDTQSFTVNALPTIPTDFTDLGTHVIDHTPSITWTKGTDGNGDTVTTYIYVGTTPTPTVEETHTTGETCDLGSVVILSDGTVYYYRLKSSDGYENSDYTTVSMFRMNTPPTNPASWTDLGTNLTNNHPTITWSGQGDADGDTADVYVYVGTGATPTDVEGHSTSGTLNLGSAIPLDNGMTYYYRLQSYDGYEWNGAYTASDTFSMATTPPTPHALVIENIKTDNQINPSSLLYNAHPLFSWLSYDVDNLLYENTTETSTNSGVPILAFQWTATYAGAFGIGFDLHLDGGGVGAIVQIWKNGVYVSPYQFQTTSTNYVTFVPLIDNWQVGDNIQLYYYAGGPGTAYLENFRIYGTTQIAYEVWVGTSLGASNKWSSGQIASGSQSATYAGSALATNTTYYVQVRGKDNSYLWSNWTTGTFKMTSYYTIQLMWEDNNLPADTESATLTAYMGTYGTQDNTITAGHLDNVVYLERPYWMQLTYGSYYRSYVPTTDNGTIYFYITNSASLTAYTFQLVDLTGLYGPPSGTLTISKQYGASSVIITAGNWQADLTFTAYLIRNTVYQLTVKSDLGGVRAMGGYTVALVSPILVQVGVGSYPDPTEIWSHIYWTAYRDTDNTTIRAIFIDNSDNCLTASVAIYDENGTLVQFFEPDNGNFIVSYLGAHPDSGYSVVLYETRDDPSMPIITFTTPIPAVTGPSVPSVTPPETPGAGFGNPIPLTAIGSFIILAALGLSFDAVRPQIAGIAIALMALFLWGMNWLPINVYTTFALVCLAVLCSLGFRRYG